MSDQNSENFGGNGVCGAISGSEVGREGLGGGSGPDGFRGWGIEIAMAGRQPEWLGGDPKRVMAGTYEGRWINPKINGPFDDWNWSAITSIRLRAGHPHYRQPAPIDWSGELEAVHEDGRVIGVFAGHVDAEGDHMVRSKGQWPEDWCDGYHHPDGSSTEPTDKWRIRNVTPQPTPQVDTKPDLTARMEALVRTVADETSLASWLDHTFEARAIVALLPEPVDPLEEAKTVLDVFLAAYQAMPDTTLVERGPGDDLLTYGHLRTILRAFALAGEKEA